MHSPNSIFIWPVAMIVQLPDSMFKNANSEKGNYCDRPEVLIKV